MNDSFICIDIIDKYEFGTCSTKEKGDAIKTTNNLIFFNMTNYLEDIIRSYKYSIDKIISQFNQDAHRSTILVNNVKYEHFYEIDPIINNIKGNVVLDKYEYPLYIIILMLFNQSSFAFPYIYINEQYSDNDVFISDGKDHHCIKMYYNDTTIKIEYYFTLLLRTVDEILSTINIEMMLEINNGVFDDLAILYWNINKIN